MVVFTFLDFSWKYPFWANLVQKNKIVSLSWNWYLVSFRYVEINDDAHVPCFRPEIPIFLICIFRIQSWCLLFSFRSKIHFLGKFVPKNQNLLPWAIRKCKFNIEVHFFLFSTRNIFWGGKFGPKNLNCQFKQKLGT